MALVPYTEFGWFEPGHTTPTSYLCADRGIQRNELDFCGTSKLSIWQYLVCSFIHSIHSQIINYFSRQHTRPFPSGPGFPLWLPPPPLPTCLVHTSYILLTLGSGICFLQQQSLFLPKPGQGALIPVPYHSLYHTVLELPVYVSVSLTRPSVMRKNHGVHHCVPSAQSKA